MTMMEKIKANPKQFVEEMAKVDPTKLQEIIDLLEALKETSHTQESDLLGALNNAKDATNAAAEAVADAEEEKRDADGEVVTAQGDLETAQNTAETNIGTATSALNSRNTEADDAQNHLDDMNVAYTARKTEQDQAQENLDAELPSLDSEQITLRNVIHVLEELIGEHPMTKNGPGTKCHSGHYVQEMWPFPGSFTEEECAAQCLNTAECIRVDIYAHGACYGYIESGGSFCSHCCAQEDIWYEKTR